MPFISWPVDTRSFAEVWPQVEREIFEGRQFSMRFLSWTGLSEMLGHLSFATADPSNRCVESLGNFLNRESITTHSLSKEIKKDLKPETSPRMGCFRSWMFGHSLVTRSLCDFLGGEGEM